MDPLVFGDVDFGIHDPVRENACRWHKEWLWHRDNHVRLAEGPSILDGRKGLWCFRDVAEGARATQPGQKCILVGWLEGAVVDPRGLGRSNGRRSLPRRHRALLNRLLNHRSMRLDIRDRVQLEWGNPAFTMAADAVLLNDRRNRIVVGNRCLRRGTDWLKCTATWVDIRRCRLFAGNNSPESAQQPLVARLRERACDCVLVIRSPAVHELLISIKDEDFSRCPRCKHTGDGLVGVDDIAAVQPGG